VQSITEQLFDKDFLARLERLHLVAKRMSVRRRAGARRSRSMGDGLEFADHRGYAPGDDIRFLDWPYYARMEKLLLRLFHQHSEADVVIALDCSGSMGADGAPGAANKFDYARRAAAALAYVAMGSLDRVTLVPFSDALGRALSTGRDRGKIFAVLDYLAGLGAGGRTDLTGCMRRLAGMYDSPAAVLLISDLLDCGPELSDALAHLSAGGHDATVLHLYSAADARGELDGALLLEHSETARQMRLFVTDEILASYRGQWARFRDGCRRSCISRGGTYVAACSDPGAPGFEGLILHALCRAGVLTG